MSLSDLFGSKSVERILLCLLVNDRVYASQIHRLLNAPLTPLQKAFERLEQAGIVKGELHGKTKLYELNVNYPFIAELEALLKKGYGRLSPQEQKNYYFVKESRQKEDGKSLHTLWERLKEITHLEFVARSHSKQSEGWKGSGKASVDAIYDGDRTILFHEMGIRTDTAQEFNFSNTFQWTYHRLDGLIALEHLRLGPGKPVFMFHLKATGKDSFASLHSHLCAEDSYFGWIEMNPQEIHLTWRIIGPKKNEELEYIYS